MYVSLKGLTDCETHTPSLEVSEEGTIKGQNAETYYFTTIFSMKCIAWGDNTAGFTRYEKILCSTHSHHVVAYKYKGS